MRRREDHREPREIERPRTPSVTPPATSPIDAVLGGGEAETSPWVNPFMEVYETTKAGAMKNLEDIQKQMGEAFAHRGGYFGGKHAISQAETAAKTGSYLDQLLAETSLGASEREYEDWLRSRQEQFMPMNLIDTLLGQQPFQNIVQQPGQGKGQTFQTLGNVGGQLGSAAIMASSKEFKKDISEISDEDERRIFEKLTSTPLFRYRYKFEDDEIIPHLGLIAENSPKELTFFDDRAIGLGEYISALHAAIKVMSKKIEKLEGGK